MTRRSASTRQHLHFLMANWQRCVTRFIRLWLLYMPHFYLSTIRILPAHSPTNTFFTSQNFSVLRFAQHIGLKFCSIWVSPYNFYCITLGFRVLYTDLSHKSVLDWWNRICQFKYLRLYFLPLYFIHCNFRGLISKFWEFKNQLFSTLALFCLKSANHFHLLIPKAEYISGTIPVNLVAHQSLYQNFVLNEDIISIQSTVINFFASSYFVEFYIKLYTLFIYLFVSKL